MRLLVVAAEMAAFVLLGVGSARGSEPLPGDVLPDPAAAPPPATAGGPPSAAPAPLPTAAAATPPLTTITPSLPPPPAARISVHVTGADGAELQQVAPNMTWARVCTVPCDALVSPDGFYRVGGHFLRRPSTAFRVAAAPGDGIELAVKPAWMDGWTSGMLLIVLAGVGLVVGDILLGEAVSGPGVTFGGPAPPDPGLLGAAVGTLIATAASATGGIYLLLSNRQTDVRQAPFVRPPMTPSSPAVGSWTPVPVLRTEGEDRRASRAMAAPLVSFDF